MKKRLIGAAMAAIMVMGCSFSAWAYDDPNLAASPGITVNEGETLSNNGSVDGSTFGYVAENNGTVANNNLGGIVTENNGTVNTNNGKIVKNAAGGTVETNNLTIANNYGVVTTNDNTVTTNHSGAKVTTNNGYVVTNMTGGTVKENYESVETNNGIVTTNKDDGKVNTNKGYVTKNEGTVVSNSATVQTNTLTGEVTNDTNGKVYYNYGTVKNATLDTDGKTLVYDSGKTLYAVTYGDNTNEAIFTVYSNIQLESTVKSISVLTADAAGASRSGYKFVSWKANKSDGTADDTAYVGGETYTISMPVWFEAIWEKIQQQEEKQTTAEQEEKKATITGTEGSPAEGQWNVGPGGYWTYRTDGILKNTWGYIANPYAGANQPSAGWFWFDKNGVMATGWKQINNKWYYFNEAKDGTQGMMLVNTTTPDGYKVDADGAMIQ